MTIIPTNTWPQSSRARHFLLFAQSARLLLSENAFESFRAPSLDNLTRLREFISLCRDVLHKQARQGTLNAPRAELVHYLRHDAIADAIMDRNLPTAINYVETANLNDFADVERSMNISIVLLKQISSFYDERLHAALLEISTDLRSKIDMQDTLRDYLSRIMNIGYDRRYILDCLEKAFFTQEIKRVGAFLVKRFTKNFDGKRRSYDVFIPMREKDAKLCRNYEDLASHIVTKSELPSALEAIVDSSQQFSSNDLYFKYTSESLDPYSATDRAYQLFSAYLSISVLNDKGASFSSRSYAFSMQNKTSSFNIVHQQKKTFQPLSMNITKLRGKYLSENIDRIFTRFDENSQQRFLSSLRSVSLARETASSDNQVTLLWSAVETLFSDPRPGVSRIGHYKDILEPLILLNYPWRYSNAVFNQVEIHARKSLDRALDAAGIDQSLPQYRRFQLFVLDPANAQFHPQFLSEISANPSLLHLVFKFYRRFAKPSDLRRSFNEHKNRVLWQIERVYRARNQFVHSGYKNPTVDHIVINAYEYFRTSAQAVLFHADHNYGIFPRLSTCSIEQIVESARVCYLRRCEDLDKANLKDALSTQLYLDIFSRL